MFDGFKSQLLVSADLLLQHPRLSFPLLVEEQTGAVLSKFPRKATDRGLTFTLKPKIDGSGYRIELTGSIHKYRNNGHHNADQFTAADLLAALIEWVETYGINPTMAILNNIEFGVNVALPFPVACVLDNLISYKGRRFQPDREHGPYYWQCLFGQYAVKIYDKGAQFRDTVPGLPPNLLRVEVKVLKMEYLHKKGISIKTLADLLTVAYYGKLGALLVETFQDILFDKPTINPALLKPKDRELLISGRNPKFWAIPDGLTGKAYDAQQKSRKRKEQQFRALLDQHRAGANWQNQIAGFIGQTWAQLTTVTPELATTITNQLAAWQMLEKCPVLTALPDQPAPGEMSGFDHLYLVSEPDITGEPTTPETSTRETPHPGVMYCPVTGVLIDDPRPRQRFVSGEMLARDAGLLAEVSGRYGQYTKGSKESEPVRAAHNVRNSYHNPRNNLKRRIGRVHGQPVLSGLDVDSALRLTADQRALRNRL
jgi:hypothetical protein